MRTITEADIVPLSPSLGARKQSESMATTTDVSPQRSRINSNHSERDSVLSDYTFLPSSPSSASLSPSPNASSEDDIDYLNEFICPTDSEDESSHFSNENNDDFYVEQHLPRKKQNFVNDLQDNGYQRSKRSNKKMNAQRQIKTKHAKSIQIKSHNKHLYIHHRLAKKVSLDEPRLNCIPSSESIPLYSPEELRSLIHQLRRTYNSSYIFYSTPSRQTHRQSKYSNETYINESQMNLAIYQEYTLNEYNIPDEPSYDDTMINFILDMQNRDLSPEDYEMLLRLDERVQRKTVNTNILDTLPTISANQTHLDDQCTICMEKYNLEQELKLLPCTHIFHSHCIETYLKEFSIQCPLDNLPLL